MSKVKGKRKGRLVAVRLSEKELAAIAGQKRPGETLSAFIRAAVRHFAWERSAREIA